MNTNEEALQLVQHELDNAGKSMDSILDMEKLEAQRITPDMVIPPHNFLFCFDGKPCFPTGELIALTGKQKSGKTFVCSILMALCSTPACMGMRRMANENLKVVWIDTEQSEESTQDILKNRIMKMLSISALPSDRYYAYNLRNIIWQERINYVETAIKNISPDLVIFDGIRDCVNDINDQPMAQSVLEKVMHLAGGHRHCADDTEPYEWAPCCIVCVLHQNKAIEDKTLRGALGTELGNKCFETYECTKDSDRVFSVKQTSTRKFDIIKELKYTVDNGGLPRIWDPNQLFENIEQSKSEKYMNPDGTYNIEKIFTDAIPDGERVRAARLCDIVMDMLNIISKNLYEDIKNMALAKNIINKEAVTRYEVYYTRSR